MKRSLGMPVRSISSPKHRQRREVTERRRSPSLPRSRVARGCLEIRNEMPAERLSQVRQRISALYRIPFVQPCHLQRVV